MTNDVPAINVNAADTPDGSDNSASHESIAAGQEAQVVPGIYLCQDGVLRWTHELSLWKNTSIFLTTWKILAGVVCALALFMFFLELENGFVPAGLLFLRFAGIGILLATILLLLGYALVAVVQGGTYNVLFEMDERGVKHTQLQKQFKRAQVLAFIGMLAGAAAANPTVVGTNMLAASKASSYSEFKSVTKIIAKPRRNTIYVNSSLEHNQIYADPAQFAFVLDFIAKHSSKAQVK